MAFSLPLAIFFVSYTVLVGVSSYEICEEASQLMDSAASNMSEVNIVLNLCPGNLTLNQEIKFSDKNLLYLIGSENSALICTDEPAGIQFVNVTQVRIQDVIFQNCSSVCSVISWYKDPNNVFINFSSGVFISKSINVSILNTTFSHSKGRGLAIFDSYGNIDIRDCLFENSLPNTILGGGGGLYVQVNNATENDFAFNRSVEFKVVDSVFRSNSARAMTNVSWLGNGGGLQLQIIGSDYSIIHVENCEFYNNTAHHWGGGMRLDIHNLSHSNTITIINSNFHDNKCIRYFGGGVYASYYFTSNKVPPKNNTMKFMNCNFDHNVASYSGGVYLSSTPASISQSEFASNEFYFENCSWNNNSAHIGAALHCSPWFNSRTYFNTADILATPTFVNCKFIGNHVRDNTTKNNNQYISNHRGKGTFYSLAYKINFEGDILFENNTGSGLYLIFTTLRVANESTLKFIRNTGYNGGAISIYSTSTLHLDVNVKFVLTGNRATVRGGAIYQENIESLDFLATKNCFIYYNLELENPNITFIFKNNKASEAKYGHSLFLSSLTSCEGIFNFNHDQNEINGTFTYTGKIAKFIFQKSVKKEVSTDGTKFNVRENNITTDFSIIPGITTVLPLEVNNDFDEKVYKGYQATVIGHTTSINIEQDFSQIFFNRIRIRGDPQATGNISLYLSSTKDKEIILPIILEECPPGYFLNSTKTCSCSAYSDKANKYLGIDRCYLRKHQAYLKRGYWIGYIKNDKSPKGYERNLVSSLCPRKYCNSSRSEILLPQDTSIAMLESSVCVRQRRGILCAECKKDYSVFYHTRYLHCRQNEYCEWGWLFYVLSELLPVTVLFMIIVVFDIHLTSGSVQGFLLYMQTVDTLLITANQQLWLNRGAYRLYQTLLFIADFFNLTFFNHKKLSFCLWKNASSLDILAIKYVTIMYSLGLVFLTVVILNYCKFNVLHKYLRRLRSGDPKVGSSIIHGMSGFLVICYSQCTKTTLLILTPITLYHKGHIKFKTVAFYDGRLDFLSGGHLLYGIPALMFLLIMVLLPPALLLTYPLCYRVLSLLRLEESKFSRIMCKVFPLEKLRPFFDSFQKSFKDEYRFFSGLYFIYRFLGLMTFAFFHNLTKFYTMVEIQFIVVLTVHSWVQPYKKTWHNKLDTFIFSILITVNTITTFNFSTDRDDRIAEIAGIIQVLLLYLPVIYMVVYIFGVLILKIKQYSKFQYRSIHNNNDLNISLLVMDRHAS